MGKLIGFLVGMIFGPIGALLGLLAGALFDARVKFEGKSFFFYDFDNSNAFEDYFPLLASGIIRAGGVDRTSVVTVKNLIIQLFGTHKAGFMMKKFKAYVERGFSE